LIFSAEKKPVANKPVAFCPKGNGQRFEALNGQWESVAIWVGTDEFIQTSDDALTIGFTLLDVCLKILAI
jgi:hypothetical protein